MQSRFYRPLGARAVVLPRGALTATQRIHSRPLRAEGPSALMVYAAEGSRSQRPCGLFTESCPAIRLTVLSDPRYPASRVHHHAQEVRIVKRLVSM